MFKPKYLTAKKPTVAKAVETKTAKVAKPKKKWAMSDSGMVKV